MSSYRDLLVWQKSRVLARDIYGLTRTFPREEMFGLVEQMRRAVVSILCNIAEGQGRWSRADQCKFLYIARGSALELEAQLYVAVDLEYLGAERADTLLRQLGEVGRMLNGLIKHSKRASP